MEEKVKKSFDPKTLMMRSAVKSFVPMIKKSLTEADPFIKKMLDEKALMEHEARAVFMLTVGADGVAYIVCVALNAADQVVRVLDKHKLTDFVETLLSKI